MYCIEYFKTLQVKCGINPPLAIPLHSNIRWGTANGMLTHAYNLRQVSCSTPLKLVLAHQYSSFQPINLFVGFADELFGPITTIHGSRDGQVAKSIPWTAFSLSPADWERDKDMRAIISDANNVQQCFSAGKSPYSPH